MATKLKKATKKTSKTSTPAKKAAKKVVKKAAAPADTAPETTASAADLSIEQDIINVTGAKAKGKDEDDQTYLGRLAEAIDSDDKHWDKLSKPSQAWFERAVAANEKKKPFPALTAAEPATAAKGKAAKKSAKKAAKTPAEKPAKAAKKGNGKAADANGKKKRTGGSTKVAEIVAADLGQTLDAVLKKAKSAGVSVAETQIRKVFSQTHHFAKVFREAGMMKR